MNFMEYELKSFFKPLEEGDKIYSLEECRKYLHLGCGIRDIKTDFVYFILNNRLIIRIKPNLKHSLIKKLPKKAVQFAIVAQNKKVNLWVGVENLENIVKGIRDYQIKAKTHADKGYSKYCCFLCKTNIQQETTIDIVNPEPIRMLSDIVNALNKKNTYMAVYK